MMVPFGTGIIPSDEIRKSLLPGATRISLLFSAPPSFGTTNSRGQDATRSGEIPIISQIARILNNRCRKW